MNFSLFSKKNLLSPKDQSADFIELFFDLVFVYAITKITAVTAHHLDLKHVLHSALTFWLLWWGWTQFTWALNATNTKIKGVRMIMLVATGVAFVMASYADKGFSEYVLWFAIPYILIRIIGLILYIRVTSSFSEQKAAVISFTIPSLIGLIAVLCGALASPELRVWWWIGAIVLDMLASYIGSLKDGWNLNPGHFVERHGLIIIIALGESLIVSASAISAADMSIELMTVGGLAVVVTCLLWWSYFSWIFEKLEHKLSLKTGSKQSSNARDAFSLMHYILICGIIGISVSFEHILQHPEELLTLPIAYTLCGGYILFTGFTAFALWRTTNVFYYQDLF